jgi:hypothetical protein
MLYNHFSAEQVYDDQYLSLIHPIEVQAIVLPWHRLSRRGFGVEDRLEVPSPYCAPFAGLAPRYEAFNISVHSWPVIQWFQDVRDFLVILMMYVIVSAHG